MISIIVAMDRNKLIGNNGQLPWHIPADLKYFKEKTKNKIIVMGRKTYESIRRPLPNRVNVVISKNIEFIIKNKDKGLFVYDSIDQFLKSNIHKDREVYVIGGARIYAQFLQIADKLLITHIDYEFKGNTYFPNYDENDFSITSSIKIGASENDSKYNLTFAEYSRIKK